MTSPRCLRTSLAAALTVLLTPAVAAAADEIRFNRDVRPILADHCFNCHGPDPDSRKARLRLDTREGALDLRGGEAAVVPGRPEGSLLMARVATADPTEVMPPPEMKKPLTEAQIATLRRWIESGAEYEGHWAYEPIDRPQAPPPVEGSRARNPIDRFIERKLADSGLSLSPESERRTLYRRLALDLTGLPPTPEEADAFAANDDPMAYEQAVDAFLRSPRFGERMAVFWLDLTRYADTVGYHGDQPYSVWPYRDYVIRAFNNNMPFDQFTRENLAGDLLPQATREQKVASGYNRLLMITAEGGAQDREYRAKYAADRVRNVSTVWMGVTLGCAECHDHKYDPFTSRDFYSFSAFFADLKEEGFYGRGYPAGDWGPSIPLPTPEQEAEQARLAARAAELEAELATTTTELAQAQAEWERRLLAEDRVRAEPWEAAGPFGAASFEEAFNRRFAPEPGGEGGSEAKEVQWTRRPEWKDGEAHALSGDNSATYLRRVIRSEEARELALSLGGDDGLKVWLNGGLILERKVQRAVAPDQEKPVLNLRAGDNELLMKVANGTGGYAFYFRMEGAAPREILDIARKPADARSSKETETLAARFRSQTPLLVAPRKALEETRAELQTLKAAIPTTLVSQALPEPRVTKILRRGNWLDDGGETVAPAVPGFLPQPPVADRRLDRRDLAEWLMDRSNPLTARVFVNRLWKQFFGAGLSRKLEDIGAQGEWPSHPELLDWLASEFRDGGWNVKEMVRLMVTSAAYRQSSNSSESLREADPGNRLLARQAAFRMDAEFVRDGALAISGLLVEALGGPSAKPYQPAGYYAQLNFPKREYEADLNANQYRRGLYTHWQRTFLHPSLAAFDAPTREECTAERVRSNTPQQALTLLNDPTYVEAARALAERILSEGGDSAEQRIRYAFRRALAREPRSQEVEVLKALQAGHAREFAEDPEAARALLSIGLRPAARTWAPEELASWTSVARAILNLHEVITRS